ncbi:RDD family protein [Candidatus Woesearchaeota archaeon]|nr:RDD family protein [Candidatus Woesearchaeota archaeon]
MKKRGLKLPKERTFTGPAMVWKRVLSFIADLLIINLIIFFPFKSVIQRSIPEFSSYSEAYNFLISNPAYTRNLTFLSIIMSALALLYFALMEYKLHQTVGKMLFHINVASDAKKAAFWQFIVRSLFIIPLFPFFILWVIDPLFMFFTKTNQRLSEIISKTKTLEVFILK